MTFMKYATLAVRRQLRNLWRKNHELKVLDELVLEDNHPYRTNSQPVCIRTPPAGAEADDGQRELLVATMKKWEIEGHYMGAATIAETLGMTDMAISLYEIAAESADSNNRFYAQTRADELRGEFKPVQMLYSMVDKPENDEE